MAAVSRRGQRAAPLIILLSLFAAACAPASPSASALPTSGSTPTASPTTPEPSPTAAAFPLTLVDDEGTEVTIAERPERIVSLTPATTEILFAIGAGPRVLAKVEDIADYPPEAATLPVVATFAGVDVEAIVALEADLVVAGGTGLSQGPAVEQLRNAGVVVLVTYPTTVDEALDGIRTIGLAAGEAEAANTLVRSMAAQIEAIRAVTADAVRPRVFYEIDYGQAIFTPPADSIYGEMIRLAGGDPVSGDPGYAISIETLVAADPQVILLGDAAYGVTAEQVAARPGWADMAAVVEGRIHPVDDILITRPGPRLVQGLQELLGTIHPELLDGLPLPSLDKLPLPSVDPELP